MLVYTPGVHRDDHDFASYYTFSLAVANDAENDLARRWKKFDDGWFCSDKIPQRDGRTDGRT